MYVSCVGVMLGAGCPVAPEEEAPEETPEEAPQETLIGTWGAAASSQYACRRLFTFAPDGTYEVALTCSLLNGIHGYEATVGKYVVNGSTIRFPVDASSCPDVVEDLGVVTFELDKDRLRLQTDAFAYKLVRREDDGIPAEATIVWGCYDANWRFTERPLTRL